MNKKKLFFSLLLVVLIGSVLFLYNSFNGNPISKFIGKQALENYLEETYPNEEFRIKEGFYNFKYSDYQFEVVEIGAADKQGNVKEYSFRMRGTFSPDVRWDGRYYANLDEQMANELSRQATSEMLPLLSDDISNIHHFEVQIEVLKGKFDEDVEWSKNLELDKPMEIFVQIDSTDQSKEEFLATAKKIKAVLDDGGYDYETILYNASGFDMEGFKAETQGYLKYSLKVAKNEAINMKKVEEHNQGMW